MAAPNQPAAGHLDVSRSNHSAVHRPCVLGGLSVGHSNWPERLCALISASAAQWSERPTSRRLGCMARCYSRRIKPPYSSPLSSLSLLSLYTSPLSSLSLLSLYTVIIFRYYLHHYALGNCVSVDFVIFLQTTCPVPGEIPMNRIVSLMTCSVYRNL